MKERTIQPLVKREEAKAFVQILVPAVYDGKPRIEVMNYGITEQYIPELLAFLQGRNIEPQSQYAKNCKHI